MSVHKGGLVTSTTPQSEIDNWAGPGDRVLSVRLDPAQHELLRAYAEAHGSTPSVLVRQWISEALTASGTTTTARMLRRQASDLEAEAQRLWAVARRVESQNL